jgi:hypothetical protein
MTTIALSANKNYLVVNGKDTFVVGDSGWDIIVGPSFADAKIYLDDRQSRGFNAIIVELIEHLFTVNSPAWATNAGLVPFTDINDFSTVQDAYFNYALSVIQEADKRGIMVFLTPCYLGSTTLIGGQAQGWIAQMQNNGATKCTNYGNYVGTKFASQPNIIWVAGGDRVPSATGSPSQLDLVNDLMGGVIAGDGGAHLVTGHWGGGANALATSVAGLTFTIGYEGMETAAQVADTQTAYAQDLGIRPIAPIEEIYENEHSSTSLLWRQQMYQPVACGATGFFFGNDPIWFFGNNGDGNPGWTFSSAGAESNWKDNLGSNGALYTTIAANFFNSIPWQALIPDTTNQILTAGYVASPTTNNSLLSRTSDGRLAFVYFSVSQTVTIDLRKINGTNIRAQWFDPSNGTYSAVTGSPFTRASRNFTTPGNNAGGDTDWVLVIDGIPDVFCHSNE